MKIKRHLVRCMLFTLACLLPIPGRADLPSTIERIKPSIVVVGTFKQTNSPPFSLGGTGFAVGNGNLIATNAHVVPESPGPDSPTLAIHTRSPDGKTTVRPARIIVRDSAHDLAILRIDGPPLPALVLSNSKSVVEGQSIAFTGFPIGGVLGFSPVTHRGIVSSITPIAIPGGNSRQLNPRLISQLKSGIFDIFQLDATAYPGNSGSPVFDVDSGEVIGIINMVFVKGSKEAALTHPSGITYAIPANFLASLIQNLP